MMIPEETVNRIRQETNIVDVVSQYVQLKKVGKIFLDSARFMKNERRHFQ